MPAAVDNDFQLFTSMRYDPRLIGHVENNKYSADTSKGSPLYMFRFHRDRMMLAASHFGWHAAVSKLSDLAALEAEVLRSISAYEAINNGAGKALKLRLLITCNGEFSTACSKCAPVSLLSLFPSSLSMGYTTDSEDFTVPNAPWPVAVDPHGTPKTDYTRWKTTLREMYDSARARVGIESPATPKEVLLQNEDGELTEGSYTSCFFFRNGRWVTPPVTSGGQQGTTRRWALENGLAVEEVVPASSLKADEGVWVTNGVKGFTWGRVTSSNPVAVLKTVKAATGVSKPVGPAKTTTTTTTTITTVAPAQFGEALSRKSSLGSTTSSTRSSCDYSTRDWISAVHQRKEKPVHEIKSVWKDWILA